MKLLENIELKDYTTFRMGGVCKKLYIPQSTDELIELTKKLEKPIKYIGGGSNLLINDEQVFDSAVLLREFDDSVQMTDDGVFIVGASLRIQKLIRFINELGYGGIEYLYSVPALVGGAVLMNAGRGVSENKCISDYIVEVKAWHNGDTIVLKKEECCFSYRNSIFKNGDYLILSVKFKFAGGTKEQFDAAVKERLEHCKIHQDASKPNFGTVFCKADNRVMRFLAKLDKNSGGVHFSQKTRNWLVNENGTFKQAKKRLNRVKFLHKLIGKECKTEVVVWE